MKKNKTTSYAKKRKKSTKCKKVLPKNCVDFPIKIINREPVATDDFVIRERIKEALGEHMNLLVRINEMISGCVKRETFNDRFKKGDSMTKEEIKKQIAEKKAKIKELEKNLAKEDNPDAVFIGDTIYKDNIPHLIVADDVNDYILFVNKETNTLWDESLTLPEDNNFITLNHINSSLEGRWAKLPTQEE